MKSIFAQEGQFIANPFQNNLQTKESLLRYLAKIVLINSVYMQSPDYTYGNDYKLMDSKSSEANEPFNKMIVMNPELKNLNLKAVENIVLQKLINQKMYNSENNFMNLRKVKQRNRIKTAG